MMTVSCCDIYYLSVTYQLYVVTLSLAACPTVKDPLTTAQTPLCLVCVAVTSATTCVVCSKSIPTPND